MRLANDPKFPRWVEQVTATGGCAHPIHLTGWTTTRDAATGEILSHYSTRDEPGERLLVRCRNRRASVCPSCSRLHAGDTFHLVRAGLTGGKTVPPTVRTHPRLFVTLTAPSFGPVHRAAPDGQRCRPRRERTECEHGRPQSCPRIHAQDDPQAGQPLCPACYDYTAHVLWHAHAGELWSRLARAVRRYLATSAGVPQNHFPRHARLSFAKVAEYQQRAAIHLHAVIRLDGPQGPGDSPPPWGTAQRLIDAVRGAARRVLVHTPYSPAMGELALRWGTELDARPLQAFGGPDGLADDAVAAYVAKYVTKGATTTGTTTGLDHRIRDATDIDRAPVTPHARALMLTCWRLGGLPEFAHLNLQASAHTLGYRGHILTKSRVYSTTYAKLRVHRAEYERGAVELPAGADVITEANWRYLGSGHTSGAALIAAEVAQSHVLSREFAREDPAHGVMRGEAK
ncbi:replication initiator [Streptomyces sp. NPDC052396]|uniref:replication initiator n=1 Tax=Streptomyces sp. NPDC052396 TaxID=3365689 RepID=UPI0037CFBE07